MLIRKFGSAVGVCVMGTAAEERVGVGEKEPAIGWERSDEVGVHETGRKGVGVGDGFGADVTMMNGAIGCSTGGALTPHPASNNAARMMPHRIDFMAWSRLGSPCWKVLLWQAPETRSR